MTAPAMTEPRAHISGEARAAAKRRRMYTVLGVLFAVGFVSGFGLAFAEPEDAGILEGKLPVWVAVTLSAVWLVAMIGGTWWYKRHVDELEVRHNVWAMAVAGTVVMIGYPVWWLLWRGEIVPEPNAHIIWVALYFVMIAVYLWKKFR